MKGNQGAEQLKSRMKEPQNTLKRPESYEKSSVYIMMPFEYVFLRQGNCQPIKYLLGVQNSDLETGS